MAPSAALPQLPQVAAGASVDQLLDLATQALTARRLAEVAELSLAIR